MDELGDVVVEHHCHQPLEHGGGITVPLLHHLTHEGAESLNMVENAVLGTSSSLMRICSYASDMSNLDL